MATLVYNSCTGLRESSPSGLSSSTTVLVLWMQEIAEGQCRFFQVSKFAMRQTAHPPFARFLNSFSRRHDREPRGRTQVRSGYVPLQLNAAPLIFNLKPGFLANSLTRPAQTSSSWQLVPRLLGYGGKFDAITHSQCIYYWSKGADPTPTNHVM